MKCMHTYKQNTTDNSVSRNGINYPSQDTTALQPSVFLAGNVPVYSDKDPVKVIRNNNYVK